MYFCMLWCLSIAVIGALYTCDGPNELDREWPTKDELIDFNGTTEGKKFTTDILEFLR